MPHVVHWDEVERRRLEAGPLDAWWTDLGEAVGTFGVGVCRIEIEPGKRSTPVHVHGAEEEIFYVLGGSGLSWQDGKTYEVGEGDCLVHLPTEETHSLIGGPGGLDVLAYGTRVYTEFGLLPRAGVYRFPPNWVAMEGGDHPWEREVAAGELELPAPEAERPRRIVNLADVEGEQWGEGDTSVSQHDLGMAAGSVRTGLRYQVVPKGKRNAPPHCHSAEEEIFVVLDGEGTLELEPSPVARARGAVDEQYPVRRGTVVGRPAGTRIGHSILAGENGLRLLAYGTREANDIAYYPRSNKIYWRGVGVIGRIEALDYWEGERG